MDISSSISKGGFWLKICGTVLCGINFALIYIASGIPNSKDNVYYPRDIIVTACLLFFFVEATLALAKAVDSCPHIIQLYMLFLGFVFNIASATFCFVIYSSEKGGPDGTVLPLVMGILALCTAIIMILDMATEYYTGQEMFY